MKIYIKLILLSLTFCMSQVWAQSPPSPVSVQMETMEIASMDSTQFDSVVVVILVELGSTTGVDQLFVKLGTTSGGNQLGQSHFSIQQNGALPQHQYFNLSGNRAYIQFGYIARSELASLPLYLEVSSCDANSNYSQALSYTFQ